MRTQKVRYHRNVRDGIHTPTKYKVFGFLDGRESRVVSRTVSSSRRQMRSPSVRGDIGLSAGAYTIRSFEGPVVTYSGVPEVCVVDQVLNNRT